jgi:deoxyribose-phosphate aldolase
MEVYDHVIPSAQAGNEFIKTSEGKAMRNLETSGTTSETFRNEKTVDWLKVDPC